MQDINFKGRGVEDISLPFVLFLQLFYTFLKLEQNVPEYLRVNIFEK